MKKPQNQGQKGAIGLQYLSPDDIERNPENPRIVFEEAPMQGLINSINEVGILVPLIVFYDDEKAKYILLDGERRLRCAKTLMLLKVPANIVAKPTRLQNILEMFNIHNVRIEWGPMEVAWKLKVLMKEFGYQKEKDLARLTTLKTNEIRRAKKLLSYDKKYQNMVHKGQKHGGIKEDFLIELKPIIDWLQNKQITGMKNINKFIDVLIRKHRIKIINNYVKDFRDLNKIIRSNIPGKKIDNIFKKLFLDPKYSVEDAYETSIKYSIGLKEIESKAKKLSALLKDFHFESTVLDDSLINTLSSLQKIIGYILRSAKHE